MKPELALPLAALLTVTPAFSQEKPDSTSSSQPAESLPLPIELCREVTRSALRQSFSAIMIKGHEESGSDPEVVYVEKKFDKQNWVDVRCGFDSTPLSRLFSPENLKTPEIDMVRVEAPNGEYIIDKGKRGNMADGTPDEVCTPHTDYILCSEVEGLGDSEQREIKARFLELARRALTYLREGL